MFDATADAMLLVDSSGQVTAANPSALELLEYPENEICGIEVEALMPENFRHKHHKYRNEYFKNPQKRSMGSGRDLYLLSKNGKELAVDIGLSPIESNGNVYILITFYPADKRRQAELSLRVNQERLNLAKQAANLGIFDYDPKLNIIQWDERMQEIWGGEHYKPVKYERYAAAIHIDERATSQTALERASDPSGNGEYRQEYRVINPDNNIERWISTVGQMHFQDGKATRLVGVVQDITERKLLEKSLQQHLAETETIFTQQVAARTASAIAHELNQPLAAISAYSEVALHALNDVTKNPEKLKQALEGCVAQAQRAGKSLHELMAFMQKSKVNTEPFDLNETVKIAMGISKGDGYKGFKSILRLEKHIPPVLANRIQIQKVLVNLIRNGAEAMFGMGIAYSYITITVRTNKVMNMGHVTVKNTGPGINQEMAKRIFEPFFTSKPSGIGMGLAISRALVEANGGQLWVEPSNKSDATFHFTLPFAQ